VGFYRKEGFYLSFGVKNFRSVSEMEEIQRSGLNLSRQSALRWGFAVFAEKKGRGKLVKIWIISRIST
jgi:hypothetical protein